MADEAIEKTLHSIGLLYISQGINKFRSIAIFLCPAIHIQYAVGVLEELAAENIRDEIY
jgi:hypothetical protein